MPPRRPARCCAALLVLGCGAPPVRLGEARGSARVGPLVLDAASALSAAAAPDSGPVLRTAVVLRNAGPDTLRFLTGQCAVTVRAFRSPARAGAAAWQYRPPTEGGRVCFLDVAKVELAPGARYASPDLRAAVPAGDLARGALPRGTYYLAADVALAPDAPGAGRAAPLRVPAGTVVVGP